MLLYNYCGEAVNAESDRLGAFQDNIAVDYCFDETAHTNYQVFRINKTRTDGVKQYPFHRFIPGTQTDASLRITPYELAIREGWPFVVNGGTGTGLAIENSIVIDDTTLPVETGCIPLSINRDGDLGYLDVDFIGKGQSYVNSGIVSAMCGFFPLIVDYENFDYPTDIPGTQTEGWQYAQRQVIGQFGNGDYFFIVSEGRNFDNSTGFTMADVQRVCKALGVKFAYNLDGGGSTQTVIGKRIVNTVYEGTTGRRRGTFIVFNGTTQFGIPV